MMQGSGSRHGASKRLHFIESGRTVRAAVPGDYASHEG